MNSGKNEVTIKLARFTFDPLTEKNKLPKRRRVDKRRGHGQARIIQFRKSLTHQERLHIQNEYGLRLTDYIPDFSYLENVSAQRLRKLSKDPLFRAEVSYLPDFKLSPTIGEKSFRTDERKKMKELWLNSVLFPDADVDRFVRNLNNKGAMDVKVIDDRQIGGPLQVHFKVSSKSDVSMIAEMEEVRWVEEVPEIIEDNVNTAGTLQSGAASNQTIWNRGLHGEQQVIGMIDSAPLDIDHCFFRDAIYNRPNPTHRKVLSIRNTSLTPAGGHATFVAGCAAGDDLDNSGVHSRRGGAWAARLVSGNTNDFIFGLKPTSMFAELVAAANTGARIHTNSWHNNTAGTGNPANYDQTATDVDDFTWKYEDNLVLGSAGNVGEEQGPPGTAKNAICVGASQADPNEMTFGDGVSGPTADGRRKPDLMTPGCGIQSATVNTPCSTGPRAVCATSYATPHAAAAAALVRQYYVEGYYPTGRKLPHRAFTPSGALLKATLLNSTIDMTNIIGLGYPNNQEGWGLIRLDNVLFFPGSALHLRAWDTRHVAGVTTGEIRIHHVYIESKIQRLKIVLVWTDPPPRVFSATLIINNLDLEVISPDGSQTFKGNAFSGGVSVPGGIADAINNVEMVLINNPMVGEWTIRVLGTAVNVGIPGQGYALVTTADICNRPLPVSLKQFGSTMGVNVPFSVRSNLLPVFGLDPAETISLRELFCEYG